MKGGKRPWPRFRSEEYFVYEISEEMFYPNLYRLAWRRHAGAHPASVYKMEQYGRITVQMGSHSTFPNPFHSTRPEFKSSATLVTL